MVSMVGFVYCCLGSTVPGISPTSEDHATRKPLTSPFGLTEPLFVPKYWSPPSLFDLARKTGFDIESIIFCFAIGGVGAVLYNILTRKIVVPIEPHDRWHPVHRFHYLALGSPILVFLMLYWVSWNPIYPGIAAMLVGAITTALCRPDLSRNTWIGGLIFLAFYALFFGGLERFAPGYIERVWNLRQLSRITMLGIPLEELFFAFSFGTFWSSVYEHLTWHATMSQNADHTMHAATT